MYGKSFKFWCCALLFFASSTKSLRNFTIDNKQDNNTIMKNDLHANFTERNGNETVFNRYNMHKNFTMDYEDGQDVFRINSRSNGRKDNDWIQNKFPMTYVKYHEKRNQVPREIPTNFTKVNKKHSNNKNNSENHMIPYETCDNRTCIHLCCPLGDRYDKRFRNCTTEGPEYVFSDVYNFWNKTNMQTEYKKVDEMFQLIVQDSCSRKHREIISIRINDDGFVYWKYIFFENGTLYLPYFDVFVEPTSYCLAFWSQDEVAAVICSKALMKAAQKEANYFITVLKPLIVWTNILKLIGLTVSLLCMLILFLVYTILPELHNIHGFMLRRYSSIIFIFYLIDMSVIIIRRENLAYSICIASGLIRYFSSLASNFWLSAMSFDMWLTFRNFRSLTKKPEQQNRKKLLYSIIVWGIPFILTIICIIMDFVPSVPKNMIRPKFEASTCWLSFGAPDQLYNYGPKIICTVISTSLSIHTALTIMRYEKDTARRLKDSESRCYNENKKWANLYLKMFVMLFVILAIEWIVITTWEFWLSMKSTLTPFYITTIICILEIIIDIGIFILFVCKKSIIQLLSKYFRQNHRYSFKIFARRGFYSIEHVHHHVKKNDSMEKYNLRQSEKMDKEFLQ
ncbi:probable G-protein coupled receptor Mth-like 3 [Anoplolepis gracilipes]|uniref:probable G-protein coupled receptor Mth-like 3 n=1 Tax=Anoplolepis gracilipes TaxID=354296 RepID=UPI003BA0BEEB